ncbi:MAG: hypothetical protein ABI597_10000 [Gammaproteobacteria bacterium]
MRKIKFLLVDYDDLIDIFFSTIFDDHNYIGKESKVAYVRLMLKAMLKQYTESADLVIVGDASMRQSAGHDVACCSLLKNGLFFVNVPAWCKENGWIFSEYTLNDYQANIEMIEPGKKGVSIYDSTAYQTFSGSTSGDKIMIMNMHIECALKFFSKDEVTFLYIDDDGSNEILEPVAKHLNTKFKAKPLPVGWKFDIIKFDRIDYIFNGGNIINQLKYVFPDPCSEKEAKIDTQQKNNVFAKRQSTTSSCLFVIPKKNDSAATQQVSDMSSSSKGPAAENIR